MVPPPYSPFGITPSKVRYSSGWSSVWTARRFSLGTRLGPRVTAQLFRTPSSSRRRSKCRRRASCFWTQKRSPVARLGLPFGSGVCSKLRFSLYLNRASGRALPDLGRALAAWACGADPLGRSLDTHYRHSGRAPSSARLLGGLGRRFFGAGLPAARSPLVFDGAFFGTCRRLLGIDAATQSASMRLTTLEGRGAASVFTGSPVCFDRISSTTAFS